MEFILFLFFFSFLEDRHRELDDILSDMLMTVQDIPGFRENNNTTTTLTKVQSKQQPQQQQQQQFNTNTIKRSQSYNSSREESIISNSNTLTKDRCIDIYDTSSTTTTLTPPASESGRDTPLQQTQQQQKLIKNTQRELIMDLQHQSFAYPQSVRSELLSGSEDDETIPYHAREDSRPFSYGQVPQQAQNPPAGTMLKMQSGLSSPSLVRKQLGHTTPIKKIEPRNDFEEMLRKRRDLVLNEKYSISDKQTGGVGVNVNGKNNNINSEKWFNTTNGNGYHYHEPLKRSNTMDGGFGRSTSTDG